MFFISEASCGLAERRLLNDLMEYYQKLERPVANESDAVQLKEQRNSKLASTTLKDIS